LIKSRPTARNTATLSPLTKRYGDDVAALKLDVINKGQVEAAIAAAHS
jgi:NADP-dependent 3-hydroxy acid dehydrogenase YdfG